VVIERLRAGWSPASIAGRLPELVPDREAIFAEATSPDSYAEAKAKVNALLAGDATALDGQ
jgi:hypothetical protein